MSRSTEPRAYFEGPHRFLRIPLSLDYLDALPWEGFAFLERVLARQGLTVDELEHRYTEENYSQLVAVFEVIRHA